MFTVGEYLLRSTGAIEQVFNGITRRLWDDPFEWTLPESLCDKSSVSDYLDEVRHTVTTGISFLRVDESLAKQISIAAGTEPLGKVLLRGLCRAEHYQGRAFAVFQMLSNEKLPLIES